MKICLFNDLHLEFVPFDFPSEDTYDVMVWAGDIFPIKRWLEGDKDVTNHIPRDKPIYYVVGNHEYYHSVFAVAPLREYLAKEFPNITLLEDEFVRLTDEVVLYGMTMWTNFNDREIEAMAYAERRMNDYKYIYKPILHRNIRIPIDSATTAAKHDDSIEMAHAHLRCNRRLRNEEGNKDIYQKFIMVTHHSPLPTKNQNPRDDVLLNPAYIAQDALELMNDHDIVVWCHGHTHEFRDEIYNNTRILSNARGYEGLEIVNGFRPEGLIFEV